MLLAGSRAATPLILPGDCYIYLDIGLPILTLQTATQAGDWSYSLHIPNVPALDQSGLTMQAVYLQSSGLLESSEAVVLTVGAR